MPQGIAVRQSRALGLVLALLMVLLLLHTDTRLERSLRNVVFDAYQHEFPRTRINDSVIIIAIDDLSLQRHGQWPWPRRELAELINKLAANKPAAIGIDMLFSEPDRLSPRLQARNLQDQGLIARAAGAPRLPDYDLEFAAAIEKGGVTLGVVGVWPDPRLLDPADYRAPMIEVGGSAAPFIPQFDSTLRSIETIDKAAKGHGVINAADELDGVVRRVPALARVGGFLVPGMAVEVLRTTSDDPVLRVHVADDGVRDMEVGGQKIPTSTDGSWWIHFSDPEARPIFSAASFLDGSLPADLIAGRIVLIGAAATGLQDRVITPLGPMPGVSIHAEAIDNLLDGRLLLRPHWGPWVEGGLLVALSLLSILAVPVQRPSRAMLLFAVAVGICGAIGVASFLWKGWLIDVFSPIAAGGAIFALMLIVVLGQTQRQRRSLHAALAASREQQARLEGELDAARRIQSGMLPDPVAVLAGENRVDLAALMQPARTVGGDLYEFFKLDDGRLFFAVGDVSGKGLPASLFMALSKALVKGEVLRVGGDPGRGLSEAGRVIARENPEAMFVSVVAGALDLNTGDLAWCSAGHDGPYLVHAGESTSTQLATAGGPPLCMLDSFDYPTERMRLLPGDVLCLVTDGVTEALNPRDELYGSERVARAIGVAAGEPSGQRIVDRLRRDVEEFAAGIELADDLTILALRWTPRR